MVISNRIEFQSKIKLALKRTDTLWIYPDRFAGFPNTEMNILIHLLVIFIPAARLSQHDQVLGV